MVWDGHTEQTEQTCMWAFGSDSVLGLNLWVQFSSHSLLL